MDDEWEEEIAIKNKFKGAVTGSPAQDMFQCFDEQYGLDEPMKLQGIITKKVEDNQMI